MNSVVSDDVGREYLASEITNHLKDLLASTQNITNVYRELLEINLSVIAYIRAVKKRIEALKLESTLKAKDSFEVVERLSNNFPPTPVKKKPDRGFLFREKIAYLESGERSEQNEATKFAFWFQKMLDHDRMHFKPYLADEAVFHGFGRKVTTKDKVADYLINVLSPTIHYFISIQSIDKIDIPLEREETSATSACTSSAESSTPKRVLRPRKKIETTTPKQRKALRRKKSLNTSQEKPKRTRQSLNLNTQFCDNNLNNGDVKDTSKIDTKFEAVTPSNKEMGQGDCLPSTDRSMKSQTHSPNSSISAKLAQLPRSCIECKGYVRLENEDQAFREKKCTVQVSYSDDPFDVGEYIVWGVYYRNDITCRKNLLPLFESVAEMDT